MLAALSFALALAATDDVSAAETNAERMLLLPRPGVDDEISFPDSVARTPTAAQRTIADDLHARYAAWHKQLDACRVPHCADALIAERRAVVAAQARPGKHAPADIIAGVYNFGPSAGTLLVRDDTSVYVYVGPHGLNTQQFRCHFTGIAQCDRDGCSSGTGIYRVRFSLVDDGNGGRALRVRGGAPYCSGGDHLDEGIHPRMPSSWCSGSVVVGACGEPETLDDDELAAEALLSSENADGEVLAAELRQHHEAWRRAVDACTLGITVKNIVASAQCVDALVADERALLERRARPGHSGFADALAGDYLHRDFMQLSVMARDSDSVYVVITGTEPTTGRWTCNFAGVGRLQPGSVDQLVVGDKDPIVIDASKPGILRVRGGDGWCGLGGTIALDYSPAR